MNLSPLKYSTIYLTHNCNLRCAYCYAGDKVQRRMDFETGFRALEFILEHSEKSPVVTFIGGEPLIEFKLIKELVEKFEEKYPGKMGFRVSTNGTLITDEILAFFGKHRILFSISLDGNRRLHDTNRKNAGGKGSYSMVEKRLNKILRFNPYTIATSVITPETAPLLAQGVKSLFAKGFRYVMQSLAYDQKWTNDDIKTLKAQYKILADYYYNAMMEHKKIYYSPFDSRITTWAKKPYKQGDLCDIGNSQVTIAPSGNIYPCMQFVGNDDSPENQYLLGNVFDGFDLEKRLACVSEVYQDIETCKDCALLGRCSNFCGCVNWKSTGKINKVPAIVCEHERMLMPIVDKMANRLWKRNNSLFKRKFYDPIFPVSSYIEDCMIRGGSDAES